MFVSALVSFQIPFLFLTSNFITFGLGILICFKETTHKINSILLSCHIFFFNIGFIGILICNQK